MQNNQSDKGEGQSAAAGNKTSSQKKDLRPNVVRLIFGIAITVGAVVGVMIHIGDKRPEWALGLDWIYRAEIATFTLLLALLVLGLVG